MLSETRYEHIPLDEAHVPLIACTRVKVISPGRMAEGPRAELMSIAFYTDQHLPRAITVGLGLHGVEILTAYEDGASELEDVKLLDRAREGERVPFARDDDLLAEATRRQRAGTSFCGIVYVHPWTCGGSCTIFCRRSRTSAEPDHAVERSGSVCAR